MIVGPADAHRVLLCEPQAGDRFPRVEDSRAGIGDGVHVRACPRCRRRQQLKEIQGGAFAGQKSAGRPAHGAQFVARRRAIAVAELPVDNDRGIELRKDRVEPWLAADDARLAREDTRAGGLAGRYEIRGQVSGADIFRQCNFHRRGEVVTQRLRNASVGHVTVFSI